MPVKLLIAYNVKPAREEAYFQFMVSEFLPAAHGGGLRMAEAWRTVWGDYPQRLIGLVSESQRTLEQILGSGPWREMEAKLAEFVDDYQRQTVAYRNGFQFLKPK